MPTPRLLLALLLVLAALAPAAAQDLPAEPSAADAFTWQRGWRSYHLAPESLAGPRALVHEAGMAVPTKSLSLFGRPPARTPGKLTRFTRLAGMFMGRVSALAVGDVRICFNLEIR